MSRATAAGTATVRLLCRTFGISRQAYYGVQRRKATTGKVVVLPARPGVASAEAVLKAIRAVIAREPAWGGCARSGRRCGATACACRASGCGR